MEAGAARGAGVHMCCLQHYCCEQSAVHLLSSGSCEIWGRNGCLLRSGAPCGLMTSSEYLMIARVVRSAAYEVWIIIIMCSSSSSSCLTVASAMLLHMQLQCPSRLCRTLGFFLSYYQHIHGRCAWSCVLADSEGQS
jgi:hypothetical protein